MYAYDIDVIVCNDESSYYILLHLILLPNILNRLQKMNL